MAFVVVHFLLTDDVSVASSQWLTTDKTTCLWPPYKEVLKVKRAVLEHKRPELTWMSYEVVVLGSYANYLTAELGCRKARDTSSLDTDVLESEKIKHKRILPSDELSLKESDYIHARKKAKMSDPSTIIIIEETISQHSLDKLNANYKTNEDKIESLEFESEKIKHKRIPPSDKLSLKVSDYIHARKKAKMSDPPAIIIMDESISQHSLEKLNVKCETDEDKIEEFESEKNKHKMIPPSGELSVKEFDVEHAQKKAKTSDSPTIIIDEIFSQHSLVKLNDNCETNEDKMESLGFESEINKHKMIPPSGELSVKEFDNEHDRKKAKMSDPPTIIIDEIFSQHSLVKLNDNCEIDEDKIEQLEFESKKFKHKRIPPSGEVSVKGSDDEHAPNKARMSHPPTIILSETDESISQHSLDKLNGSFKTDADKIKSLAISSSETQPTDCEKLILIKLQEIMEAVREHSLLLQKLLPSVPIQMDNSFMPKLPADTFLEFDEWEAFLDHPPSFKYAVQLFGPKVAGHNLGQSTRRILSEILTNKLASNYNWAGQKPKRSFKHSKSVSLILCVVKENKSVKDASNKEIEEKIKEWLKLAPFKLRYKELKKNQHI